MISDGSSIPNGPPSGPPSGWLLSEPRDGKRSFAQALSNLREHVRAAMTIEFTTIPLYLYAVWSIKPDNGGHGTKARYAMLGIVQQEMLHLALAGNIARALDCEFRLNSEDAIPLFDGNLKMLYDKVDLSLGPAKKALLATFVKIEAPYTPPATDINNSMSGIASGGPIATEYHSIGEFYTEFRKGLKAVAAEHPDVLDNNSDMQFNGRDFYDYDMVVVKDLDTALQALDIIVDQGEGSVGVEDSHYRVFLELYRNRDMWECWPVEKNPRTSNYKPQSFLYYLNRAFSACYCYLLCTIDDIWHDTDVAQDPVRRHALVRSMHPLMMDVLTPLAEVIVQQELGDGTAGPCFEFYSEDGAPCTRGRLRECIAHELTRALGAPGSKEGGFKRKLEAVLFTVEHSLPPPK